MTLYNRTDEHVIPNALGGHLITPLATCADCNSKAGRTIDDDLIKAFSPWATQLNVGRDRGRHPVVDVRDNESGRKLTIRPGEAPMFDDAPTFTRKVIFDDAGLAVGEKREMRLSAPSKEEAVRRFRKLANSRRGKIEIGEIDCSRQPETTYSYTVSLPMAANSFRRAIMKIALCFARARGFRLAPRAIGCRFARGEETQTVPFGVPPGEAIAIARFDPTPLHHAIFLKRSGSRLLAYVALFSVFECVLLLDESCAEHCEGQTVSYLWDLETDCEAQREYKWVVSDEAFLSCLGAMSPDPERLKKRGAMLGRALKDPKGLALTRGQTAAAKEYMRLKDGGATHEAAEAGALRRFRAIAEGLGVSLGDISLSVSSDDA